MNIRAKIVFLCCIVLNCWAAPEQEKARIGVELTEEEIQQRIGRMGETEVIPEGFEFSEAETNLWLSNHLHNITKPTQLYYEFVKTGSYEEGFSDSVYLTIVDLNQDGTKDANLEFFSGSRQQNIAPENVTNIVGNPVLGIYMQGDVYEMNRIAKGHWRHFHKQIKIALREQAKIDPVTVEFEGKKIKAKRIYFSPYLNDPHRDKFEEFAEKYYEVIISNKIPGSIYKIRTIVPNKEDSKSEPLLEESLTLVSVKSTD